MKEVQLSPAVRWLLGAAAVALAGSWIGFYLITPLPYIALETFRATLVLHIVTGLVLVPYLISLVARRRLPGGSLLDLPVLALLGVYLLTTATSLNWRVSLEVALTALMAIAVFYVLSDGGLFRRRQVELAFMLAVLALAVRSLWVVGSDYLDWLRLTHAVSGSYDLTPPTVPKIHDVGDHANLVGGILAMSLPFFAMMSFRRTAIVTRFAYALGAITVAMAAFFSLSRSAWAGGGLGVCVSLTLLLITTKRGRALLDRVRPNSPGRRVTLGAVAVVIALAVVGAAMFVRSIESRPIWLFRESGSARQDVVEAGAAMVRDHPLVGTGPGVFGLLYPGYSGIDPAHAIHSHNGYLQAAVDMGAPGVIAMLALAGALGLLLYRGVRETEGDARLSIISCAGAVVALGTFALFDAPNGFKGPLVALAAVGAIAALSYQEGRAPAEQGHTKLFADGAQIAARAVLPIALAGLLITWGRLDIGHYAYSNSLGNANSGHWQQAIHDAQRAVELDPQFAVYRLQLGADFGEAYLLTKDSMLRDDGIAQLERAVELEPRSAVGHVNLARLLAETGDRERTRREALAAMRYANSDDAIVLAAGVVLEQAGWSDAAIGAYAQAVYLDLDLADSPFWSGSEFRKQHFPDILRHSVLVFSPCALLHLQQAGAPVGSLGSDAVPGCAKHVLDDPGDQAGKVTLAEALLARGKRDQSFALLNDAISRQPDFGPARTALGRWYASGGSIDKARQEWVRAGQLGEIGALVLLGDSYPAGQAPTRVIDRTRSLLGDAASDVQFDLPDILYYRFKFFRGSPIQILLPGEWQQATPGPYQIAENALARWTKSP